MKNSQTRWLVVSVTCFSLVLLLCLGASTAVGQAIGLPGAGSPPPPGTAGGELLPGGVNPVIKTPPLSDGDVVTIPIGVHNSTTAPILNWAGVLVEMHVADAAEADVAAVGLAPGYVAPLGPAAAPPGSPPGFVYPFAGGPIVGSPFGPASNNVASVPVVFTALHTQYRNSGITLFPSSAHPVLTVGLRAKNTSLPNSDVDYGLRFADIYHVPGATITIPGTPGGTIVVGGSTSIPIFFPGSTVIPGSRFFTWFQSGHAFVTSEVNSFNDLHIAEADGVNFHLQNSAQHSLPDAGPNTLPLIEASNYFLGKINPDPETGHWIHTERARWHVVNGHISSGTTLTVHVLGTTITTGGLPGMVVRLPGSHLYAGPFLSTATIGIEHVPEPAAPILLAGGLVSLALGFRTRRRRRLET